MTSPNTSLCETLHSTVIDSDPIDSMFETFGEVTAVRLSGRQLYSWHMKVENILNESCWNHVTHLIMEELYITKENKVQFGSNNMSAELINIMTYLPWLKALKRRYHWIKIFWSFIPCAHHLVMSNNIFNFIVCRR
jgi:hypothetical protein